MSVLHWVGISSPILDTSTFTVFNYFSRTHCDMHLVSCTDLFEIIYIFFISSTVMYPVSCFKLTGINLLQRLYPRYRKRLEAFFKNYLETHTQSNLDKGTQPYQYCSFARWTVSIRPIQLKGPKKHFLWNVLKKHKHG